MSYTTEERKEIERLRYESKLDVLQTVGTRTDKYNVDISGIKATYNSDIVTIKADAKAKLATDTKNVIETTRTPDEDVTGGDDDE